MKKKIIEEVNRLFSEEHIKGFVALRRQGDHIAPHVFTHPEDLDDLSLGDRDKPGDSRYPLAGLLCRMATMYPNDRFAVLVRGCDERAVHQLMVGSRITPLHPGRIILVGFSCPPELAQACQCHKPWPDALIAGEPVPGVEPEEEVLSDTVEELENWFDIFDRCVKCFGCRNICPVCDCRECTMEREPMVPQRELPASPNFLLTRAVHMVDRCVYCGLCEQVCPADIPLKSLYRFVARVMGQGLEFPGVRSMPPQSLTAA